MFFFLFDCLPSSSGSLFNVLLQVVLRMLQDTRCHFQVLLHCTLIEKLFVTSSKTLASTSPERIFDIWLMLPFIGSPIPRLEGRWLNFCWKTLEPKSQRKRNSIFQVGSISKKWNGVLKEVLNSHHWHCIKTFHPSYIKYRSSILIYMAAPTSNHLVPLIKLFHTWKTILRSSPLPTGSALTSPRTSVKTTKKNSVKKN